MNETEKQKALIKALHDLLTEIPYRKKIINADQIKLLQNHLGDEENVILNNQGKHWKKKKQGALTVTIAIRNGDSWDATYEQAGEFVNRSHKYIAHMLQVRDSMPFKVNDTLVTVSRISRSKY